MKLLIIDSTQVNYGDDRGGVHEEASTIVDVAKDTAKKLTEAGRALYVSRSDDPFKDGRFTASKEMLQAAADMAKAAKKSDPPAA